MTLHAVLSSLLLFALADTLSAPSPPTESSVVITTGTPHTLSVSGLGGGDAVTKQPAGGALLLGVRLDERRDRPCELRFYWWRNNNDNRPQGIFETELDICDGHANSANGFAAVGVPEWRSRTEPGDFTMGSGTFVAAHGLRVCLNRGGDRVKGIRLFGSTINQDNSGDVRRDPALKREFERVNCNEWKPARRCDAGEVIVGVVVHHDGDEIHGLAPKCAAVEVN